MVPVADAPEITFPASPIINEDHIISIRGLGMYDADVSRPGDEGLFFTIWLEAVVGRLSLNGSTVSPCRNYHPCQMLHLDHLAVRGQKLEHHNRRLQDCLVNRGKPKASNTIVAVCGHSHGAFFAASIVCLARD